MSKNQIQPTNNVWLSDSDAQLAIDIYQTATAVIIKTPMAGVKKEDLDISITDEVINIKGERRQTEEIAHENYFTQECYWGSFSRSVTLPAEIEPEKAEATLKNGILVIKIPKLEKSKTKMIEVKAED